MVQMLLCPNPKDHSQKKNGASQGPNQPVYFSFIVKGKESNNEGRANEKPSETVSNPIN
jgi:hypothetical protein